MVNKMNEILEQITASKKRLAEFENQKAKETKALAEFEAELKLAESLLKDSVAGVIKLFCRPFTFAWSYYGGANPNDKTWGEAYAKYFTPEEAFLLLKGDATHYQQGCGVKYERI
jgi:hypothetical protein